MTSILEYQPFKSLYLGYFVLSLVLIKVPLWTLAYIPRSRRPRPAWTIKRSIIVRTAKELFDLKVDLTREPAPAVEVSDSRLTDAKFVWIEPIPSELLRGEVARAAQLTDVRPVRIPGYWLLKKGSQWTGPKARPGEKTVLHMHGGAFYIGTANPSDVTANFTRGILSHSRSVERTFAVDYRLAASAPHPITNSFPAALLDTIAAYRYLVEDAEFEPQNIVVAGDSAGGNLAVGLVRFLVENHTTSLPPPGRLLLVSPWLDLSTSRHDPQSSMVRNEPTDIFSSEPGRMFSKYGVMSLLGPLDFEEARTNRYISPVSLHVESSEGLFAGYPETYVVAGGAERILDDSTALIQKMEAEGVKVVADIPPDAVHDLVVFTWHEPERTEVLLRISGWIDDM
ncbi:alpha/beta-hydrolase [Trametes meyenii]|nr:alpha/beta-hydrolase [Trametes meyenii]